MVVLASGDINGSGLIHLPWITKWHREPHTMTSRLSQQFWDYLNYDDISSAQEDDESCQTLLWENDPSPGCDCHCQVAGCRFCDVKSDVSDETTDADPGEFWIRELHLKNADRTEILSGDMLSDMHIFAGQKLLSRQFPHVGGFQDTCLSQTAFEPVRSPPYDHVVQIHHVRGNHWVVTSWRPGDVVEIYDSVYDMATEDLLKQISEIYVDAPRDRSGNTLYRMCNVQTQRGSRDCALFAIAFAYEVCLGYDVTDVTFAQSKMRRHFVTCLEEGRLKSFPSL